MSIPSELGLFFDGLNWAALQRANDRLQQLSQNSEGIEAAVAALAGVGAHGASLTLEQLNSRFIFNDRGPAGIGAAGDVSANGRLTLRAGAAATLADEWAGPHRRVSASGAEPQPDAEPAVGIHA